MSLFVIWNGKIVHTSEVIISPDNHSFRYGDGCFETMKIINGKILLQNLHVQRLFSSLETLQFTLPAFFTHAYPLSLVDELLHANHHTASARVRLVVYRGNGGLYDVENNEPNFIVQSFPATHGSDSYNEIGLNAGFYKDAKKAVDHFSSIKSNNYLPYVMGALYAKQNHLDDCIIANAYNRIADATIANIFIIHNQIIKTPTLSEGCVSGVMRKYLLESFQKENIPCFETEITLQDVLGAEEVFLTNATYGIRWVQKVEGSSYRNTTSSMLHKKFIVPLFNSFNLLNKTVV